MTLRSLVPQVFYGDLDAGVAFFCDGLGFTNAYRADDDGLCIVRRDGAALHLCRDPVRARGDQPQLRLPTDDIDGYHREIVARAPALLHPNGRDVTAKPWGLREFALLCPSGVCVIVEQPVGAHG